VNRCWCSTQRPGKFAVLGKVGLFAVQYISEEDRMLGIISTVDLGSLMILNRSGSYSWLEIWEVSLSISSPEIDHAFTHSSTCVFASHTRCDDY